MLAGLSYPLPLAIAIGLIQYPVYENMRAIGKFTAGHWKPSGKTADK
jgi:hypothetical protein